MNFHVQFAVNHQIACSSQRIQPSSTYTIQYVLFGIVVSVYSDQQTYILTCCFDMPSWGITKTIMWGDNTTDRWSGGKLYGVSKSLIRIIIYRLMIYKVRSLLDIELISIMAYNSKFLWKCGGWYCKIILNTFFITHNEFFLMEQFLTKIWPWPRNHSDFAWLLLSECFLKFSSLIH